MSKKLLKPLGFTLLMFASLLSKAEEPFKVDGNFAEWAKIPATYTNAEYKYIGGNGWQNAHILKTYVTDTHVFFYIEGNSGFTLGNDEKFYIFFDTDKNPATGYQHGGGAYPKVGAEVAFEGSISNPSIRKFNAAGEWGVLNVGQPWISMCNFSEVKDIEGGKKAFEFSVSRALFETKPEYVNFVFFPSTDFKAMPEAYRNRQPIKIELATK